MSAARRACGGSRPTGSTFIRCTGTTADPIEETLETLTDLVRAGKVRYFGCFEFHRRQMIELNGPPSTAGCKASCRRRTNTRCSIASSIPSKLTDDGALWARPAADFPLASGLPPASTSAARLRRHAARDRGLRALHDEKNFRHRRERLEAFVKARGHTLTELAFSWLAARRPLAASSRAQQAEQIEANVKATVGR